MSTNYNVPRSPKIQRNFRSMFAQKLLKWFRHNARPLPWRSERTPYTVTVSEFMLQQTQVAAVVPYFERWIRRFPDWGSLARARETTVLRMWEGLGYYRRARNLHALARAVCANADGLPRSPSELRKLPGIGPYTAGAIASICFDAIEPAVDGNVERVYARVFDLKWDMARPATRKALAETAARMLDIENPGAFNEALMELGATVCLPARPQCHRCPVLSFCAAKHPHALPFKSRARQTIEQERIAWIRKSNKLWLITPDRPGRWHGLWRLPKLDPQKMMEGELLTRASYSITRFRVKAAVVAAKLRAKELKDGTWMPISSLERIPMPAPHRQIARKLIRVKEQP
jgi:A/G-specific adenine glycosylase